MLDAAERTLAHRYQRDGFVIPRFQLAPPKLDQARNLCGQVIRQANAETIPNPHLPASHAAGVPGGGVEIFAIMLHPDILAAVREVIGPDVVLWSMGLFAKRARIGRETSWHQDGHYWPIRPVQEACTVWLSLDGATLENGCVRFVRGSHRRGLLVHADKPGDFRNEVDLGAIDTAEIVPAELQPGQVSIHCSGVIHGASPNRADRPRTGLAAQFMSARARYDRSIGPMSIVGDRGDDLYRQRPIWMVSGDRSHPDNDFVVGHQGLDLHDRLAARVRTGADE